MLDYSYQGSAIARGVDFARTAKPGDKLLVASPTGTGKSFMILGIRDEVAGTDAEPCYVVAPTPQICLDMARKAGGTIDPQRLGFWTPVALRNRLLSGVVAEPKLLLFDEVHHHNAETYQTIDLLCGMCPAIGFTATPYCGTPRATATFRATWGEPYWPITMPKAVETGVLAFPSLDVVPLVDDDKIQVVNGQFQVESVEAETSSKLEHAASLISSRCIDGPRPSMVSVPTRYLADELVAALLRIGCPADKVDGETPQHERDAAFARCVGCESVLVQIQVVSEGVDLPIRRLFDLHPMLSPREWLQQFGRITRPTKPGEPAPEYIGFNRNLLRHAYLLEGLCPPTVYATAEKAFGKPSSRFAVRAMGFETLGRFAGSELPLADGTTGALYSVASFDKGLNKVICYACIVHPLHPDPVWARRENARTDDPRKPNYGRWYRCDPPTDLAGFASSPPAPVTEKQAAWWKKSAVKHGLAADAKVTRKNFAVLPILSDLRATI